MKLHDRVVVVTGASRGIGAAGALHFAAEGASVVLVARDRSGLDGTVDAIRGRGGQAHAFVADVTDPDQCAAAANFAVETCGRVDGLFNNAGAGDAADAGIVDTSYETWTAVIRTNLDSVFLMSRAIVPHLVEAGGGAIVNNASMVAHIGSATPQIAYCAAKGGVLAMTREMAIELADRHIRVNAVSPGPVATDLYLSTIGADARFMDRRLPHMPMKRLGDAPEIAMVAGFLLSHEASYVTGQSIVADGGITAAYTVHPD